MSISANTLFHFTPSIDNLVSILKYEFKPQYRTENSLQDLLLKDEEGFETTHVVPMVCFCDLPLSNINEHMKSYGRYALGMSKSWGIKGGLNPLIYLCQRSDLTKTLEKLRNNQNGREFSLLEAYIKPYSSRSKKNIRFYDENEWRYVPIAKKGDDILIKPEVYTNEEKLVEANRKIGERYGLSFEPQDIKYIIIKEDSERGQIIDAIADVKSKYAPDTIKILSSRILSSRQILEDF